MLHAGQGPWVSPLQPPTCQPAPPRLGQLFRHALAAGAQAGRLHRPGPVQVPGVQGAGRRAHLPGQPAGGQLHWGRRGCVAGQAAAEVGRRARPGAAAWWPGSAPGSLLGTLSSASHCDWLRAKAPVVLRGPLYTKLLSIRSCSRGCQGVQRCGAAAGAGSCAVGPAAGAAGPQRGLQAPATRLQRLAAAQTCCCSCAICRCRPGEWQELALPLSSFVPTQRGRLQSIVHQLPADKVGAGGGVSLQRACWGRCRRPAAASRHAAAPAAPWPGGVRKHCRGPATSSKHVCIAARQGSAQSCMVSVLVAKMCHTGAALPCPAPWTSARYQADQAAAAAAAAADNQPGHLAGAAARPARPGAL
jgi:hypothetical protein